MSNCSFIIRLFLNYLVRRNLTSIHKSEKLQSVSPLIFPRVMADTIIKKETVYRISRASLYELKDHLISCYDLEYIDKVLIGRGKKLIEEAKRTLNGYITYVRNKKKGIRVGRCPVSIFPYSLNIAAGSTI